MSQRTISICSLALILLAACQSSEPTEAVLPPTPTVLPPTPTVPAPDRIIDQAIDAWNAGDSAALKTFYSEDAVVCHHDMGDECATGTEEISTWIEELVAMNFAIEVESLETEGDSVTVVAQVWDDPTRELGIAPLETTDVYTLHGDKITNQTSTLTKESSNRLAAAIAAEQNSAVVLSFVEAINAGDIEGAMGFLSKNVYVDLSPTLLPGFPTLSGMQKVVGDWLEEMVAVHLSVEAQIVSAQGNTVTLKSKIWSDYLESLHAAPIEVDEVYEISDGQIESWDRVIPPESLNKVQEGLIGLGIPDTVIAEPGEVLASTMDDIAGSWITTIIGAGDVHIALNADGKYEMEGDSGSFWFNGPFLWMRTDKILFPGDVLHSCQDTTSIASYAVYMTRSGGQSVALRFVPILDTCMLRTTFLSEQPLTPDT